MTVVVAGDNIVDVFADLDIASIGGNCLNVAVHLERAGVPTRYIGSLGDDELGTAVLAELSRTELGIEHVQKISGGTTGYAMIRLVDGERHFGEFDRGAGVVHLGERQWKAIEGARLIYTSYSSVMEDRLPDLSRMAPVAFDFDSHINDDYSHTLAPFITHGFFSASACKESEIDDRAQELLEGGMRTVTMTRGDRGALHFTPEGKWTTEAEEIVAADTLGAGDAFIAGILAGITNRTSVEDMLRDATARASEVCTKIGSLGLYVNPALVQRQTMSP